ncbi:MAG: universal stress protein [Gammaproteobacteria bacterium]|nr:universal stress protein [Gammaproteobacteria bacterium]
MRAATQGTLHVLHAGASWEEAIRKRPDLQDLPAAVQEDIRGAWWNGIREQVSALARRHAVTDDCVEVIEGEAAELVPRVAHSHSAAIVALGAVSRSALGRALIGHTAERVLDALECDVLIVKPADFRTPVSRESTHRVVQDTAQVPGNPAS